MDGTTAVTTVTIPWCVRMYGGYGWQVQDLGDVSKRGGDCLDCLDCLDCVHRGEVTTEGRSEEERES